MISRKVILATSIIIVSTLLTLLVAEGAYSIIRWDRMDRSLTHRSYLLIKHSIHDLMADREQDSVQLLKKEDFDSFIPLLMKLKAGLGNTPYKSLVTDQAAFIYRDQNGCLRQKPNVRKIMVPLRTMEFDPLDPPNLILDSEGLSNSDIAKLVANYGGTVVPMSTNELGERVTVPLVNANRKVLVVGDSVAQGARLDDADTIASQLQSADLSRQYINLGLGGAKSSDILCSVEYGLQRYKGGVDTIIYVFSESDFRRGDAYQTPGDVISKLAEMTKKEGVQHITVVLAPFIYNVIPQHTRFRGYRGDGFPTYSMEAKALEESVKAFGFKFIDIRATIYAELRAAKTDFAAFSFFIDQSHPSASGAKLIAHLISSARQ